MHQYLKLVSRVLNEGRLSDNRTGTKTLAVFGHHMTFDLAHGFPLVTTKEVNLKAVLNELIWFIHGKTNIQDPELAGCKIWNEWAVKPEQIVPGEVDLDTLVDYYANKKAISRLAAENTFRGYCVEACNETADQAPVVTARAKLFEELETTEAELSVELGQGWIGSIGPMYGAQWRDFGGVDQLKELLVNLKERPFSRRHLVSAWNPEYLPDETQSPEANVLNGKGALAPCHCFFQYDVERLTPAERERDLHNREYRLNCQFYMRSSDVGLGLPFNIASYAALQIAICNELDYAPGKLNYCGGNVHIYENHVEQLREQTTRAPRELPRLVIKRPVGTSIFDLRAEDFAVVGYDPHPAIKLPISK